MRPSAANRLWLGAAAFALAALLCVPAPLAAQGTGATRQDRNRARPYFDPPRETTTVSATALYSWAAYLLEGVERPAAVFAGNAELASKELLEAQEAQLAAATAFVYYGGEGDGWLGEEFASHGTARRPVVRLGDEGSTARGHEWLDPVKARDAVRRLAAELKQLHPARVTVIDKNAQALDEELRTLDEWARRELTPFQGSAVYLERPGLEPFLERYGLAVAGYLSSTFGNEGEQADADRLAADARQRTGPLLMLRRPGQLPIPMIRLSQQVPIRFILVDPIESGEARPAHYVRQMRQNVLNVVVGLTAAQSIPASFTPAPEATAATEDEAEDGGEE
ncbi:MAG: zinc ABC transporter substrate-binding protein [Candidatus Sumerlaeia bacterium]|nr:zinc ABC transporter substrate-binding protein [Candidatus Sumerlaeia bacterium]